MKNYFKRLARRFVFWAFKENIRVFQHQKIISDAQLVSMKGITTEHILRDMVTDIAVELYREEFVNMSVENCPMIKGKKISAIIYVLK